MQSAISSRISSLKEGIESAQKEIVQAVDASRHLPGNLSHYITDDRQGLTYVPKGFGENYLELCIDNQSQFSPEPDGHLYATLLFHKNLYTYYLQRYPGQSSVNHIISQFVDIADDFPCFKHTAGHHLLSVEISRILSEIPTPEGFLALAHNMLRCDVYSSSKTTIAYLAGSRHPSVHKEVLELIRCYSTARLFT